MTTPNDLPYASDLVDSDGCNEIVSLLNPNGTLSSQFEVDDCAAQVAEQIRRWLRENGMAK